MSTGPVRAEILAVGSELTTGSTRDAHGGELARELTDLGVLVRRISLLPDDLAMATRALNEALATCQLVISTGGLGPTPDDLTREAIAAACGLEPYVDPELEAWLNELFARRGIAMPEANRKQAWLVQGARALPNSLGTAPGWWVERPDGQLIIALPGPPSEMRPMWREHALPALIERGIGAPRVSRTLRLAGVGESVLVGLIGEELLRGSQPQVATYAKPDSVDVRVSAFAQAGAENPQQLVDAVVEELSLRLGEYVFAEGDEGWPEVLGRALGDRRLAVVEIGTAGQLQALLGDAPYLQYGQLLRSSAASEHAQQHLGLYAERVRETSGTDLGLALQAREQEGDTRVEVAIASAEGTRIEHRLAFLAGEVGRRRAALVACHVLWQWLRAESERNGARREQTH